MFKFLEKINENTYLAQENSRRYILKKIRPDDVEVYKKYAKIKSDFVAKVFGFYSAGENLFAVIDYIDGITLEEYVLSKNGLTDEETERLALCVCRGLEQIHSLGMVHRDISPKNIIVSGGSAVIIDFGISRTYKSDRRSDTLILGTQGYAAPEQFGFSQTSERSDIYSVGILINFMKTAALPSERTVQGKFFPIVEKCTQIDEHNRYSTSSELAADIEKTFSGKRKINFLRKIPGFRSGVWWHMLIAVIYYICAVLCTVIIGETSVSSPEVFVLDVASVIVFLFGLPFAAFSSVGSKKPFSQCTAKEKTKLIGIRLLLSLACFGLVIIILLIEKIITKSV